MKKLAIILIICIVIAFLGILYYQKVFYPIKSDPFGPEVRNEAHNLIKNPIEKFLLIGFEAQEKNGQNYILNAKTIFEINIAKISITCNQNNCSGEVIQRLF